MRSPAFCAPLVAAVALAAALLPAAAAAHDAAVYVERTEFFDPQWCPNTIARQAIQPRMASNCSTVLIPPTLCTACKLRPFDENGVFPPGTWAAQRDIYDTDAAPCRAALEQYRSQNPCDWPRARDITAFYGADTPPWARAKAKQDLGEFMYNVCELCCDCVPIGLDHKASLSAQYDARKQNEMNGKWGTHGLLSVFRGNCPVHYYYDTCRMWPNITDIGNVPGHLSKEPLDQICGDHVYPWWYHPDKYYKNWPTAQYVPIPSKRFVDFLSKMMWVTRCRDKPTWMACARMEMAQKRV